MKIERFLIHDANGQITGTASGTRESVRAALPMGHGVIRSDKDPYAVKLVDGRLRPRGKGDLQVTADAKAWAALRAGRTQRLAACDWTQTLDQPQDLRAAWAIYRAQLRALPSETTDPHNIIWPARPNEEGFKMPNEVTP